MSTEARSGLITATKIVLDAFTGNVKCVGRNDSGPFIAQTAGEIISLDPEGHGGFVVHVGKIGDFGLSNEQRFRISNPGLIKFESDIDEKGNPYKRLEISNKSRQVIIFERG